MEPSPITIAVLNDDQLYRHLVGQLLAEEGYRIVESTSGTQAYSIVREARPALVVLDIRVGSLEGAWLTLELLRLDPATARIPVILCSATTLLARDSAARLRQLGCTMIEKPFLLDELLTLVRAALGEGDGPGLREQTVG